MAHDSKEVRRPKQPSAVFYSYDYGETYVNRTDMLQNDLAKVKEGAVLQLDKFYINQKFISQVRG